MMWVKAHPSLPGCLMRKNLTRTVSKHVYRTKASIKWYVSTLDITTRAVSALAWLAVRSTKRIHTRRIPSNKIGILNWVDASLLSRKTPKTGAPWLRWVHRRTFANVYTWPGVMLARKASWLPSPIIIKSPIRRRCKKSIIT